MLAEPDLKTWTGQRDYALLAVAVQPGLRLSELTGLRKGDVQLGPGAHQHCTGTGRKERCTPLTTSRALLSCRGGWTDVPRGRSLIRCSEQPRRAPQRRRRSTDGTPCSVQGHHASGDKQIGLFNTKRVAQMFGDREGRRRGGRGGVPDRGDRTEMIDHKIID